MPLIQNESTALLENHEQAETVDLALGVPRSAQWFGSRTLARWGPILAKFACVQVAVQVLGFLAGLLIVRNLPKTQYAFYTIGNTMLGAILVLADSGISSALTAIGGRVWHNNRQLGSLLNTAFQLRRQLGMATVIAVVPVLIWLLLQNGASRLTIVAVVLAVLIGSALELITRIYAVALRLKSEIRQIQKQALFAALVKLAVVGVALLIFINATVAILSVVCGLAVQFVMMRSWTRREVDRTAPVDSAMRSEIVSVLKKQAPHSLYYCLQGQITVWLISIFGNAENVANIGALSRLAVVFTVLTSITAEVLLPAFARIQSPSQLRRRYLQIVVGYFAVSVASVAGVVVFPKQVLSILGHQYSGLYTEAILMAACAVMSATAGLLWAINCARAWIVPPSLLIPCTIALQVALIAFLDLSSVRGVLLFTMYSWIPSIVMSIWLALRRMWLTPVVA